MSTDRTASLEIPAHCVLNFGRRAGDQHLRHRSRKKFLAVLRMLRTVIESKDGFYQSAKNFILTKLMRPWSKLFFIFKLYRWKRLRVY